MDTSGNSFVRERKPFPCPLCGEPPSFVHRDVVEDDGLKWTAGYELWCQHCGIEMHAETRDELLDGWNKRGGIEDIIDREDDDPCFYSYERVMTLATNTIVNLARMDAEG